MFPFGAELAMMGDGALDASQSAAAPFPHVFPLGIREFFLPLRHENFGKETHGFSRGRNCRLLLLYNS